MSQSRIGGDQLSFFSKTVLEPDVSTEDIYLNAKHLGKWWNTPPYAEIVAAEAEIARFFRKMVDEGWVRVGWIPDLIDKIRGIGYLLNITEDSEEIRKKKMYALQRIREFIAGMNRRYNGAVRHSLDGILRDTKSRARHGCKLWRDEKYWPTLHKEPASCRTAGRR